ncbi:MFS transporter [Sphingomonas sp. CFBP 13728]|uniref:MFS transporter n=1 Tax=Sphingomonas sp. CFBP 13728 TaxID=2775294 RepID=UPI00177B6446|nr:MFS transporter [Sphingomonas sp. CFBP 13728]MBD8620835.1 MFS transporter [Sphingomonas sp. CFBP 13728]MBD8737188.1 MFS transporter [Sphingomonas sp. CFBP 13706]
MDRAPNGGVVGVAATDGSVDPAGRKLTPLPTHLKLGYAAGALLDGIASQGVTIFLFFYVTTVVGVPAALAGIALAAGLVVDALVDPLIGSLSDGWHSRFGRRLPFMAAGLPGTMLFLVLIFSLPAGWSTVAIFAWLTVLSIGLRISISLFLLPYNAVGAELSDDYAERSSIAVWRWGGAMAGALSAVVLGFGVFLGGVEGPSRRAGYTPLALTLAVIAGVGALIAMRALLTMRDRQHPPLPGTRRIHERLAGEVAEIFGNQSFRTLFVGALLLFTSLAIHSTLGLHSNTYFWRMTPSQMQSVTLSLFSGLLLGAPLAGPMLKRMEKRTVLLIGMVGLSLSTSLPTALRLVGLFPFEGRAMVTILGVTVFVGGALMAAAAISFASMMADAADEHEHLFGARREGLYFAGWAFATKAAAGIGSLVAGVALQAIGFQSTGSGHAALGADTVRWIGIINGPGAGLLALAAASTCLFYRLDARKHSAILRDLIQRRQDATSHASETAA